MIRHGLQIRASRVEIPSYKCIVSDETIGYTSMLQFSTNEMFRRNIASIARGFNPGFSNEKNANGYDVFAYEKITVR